MNGTDFYYWDSCLFLAWLKNEKRPEEEMNAVKVYARKAQERQIKLITSVIMCTEVPATKLPADVAGRFFEIIKKHNIFTLSVDIKIATLARELRDYYSSNPDKYNKKTLSTPDSLHLATAIIHKAKEFHTFDKSNKHGSLGLLGLNRDVGGRDLTICKPKIDQREIDFK